MCNIAWTCPTPYREVMAQKLRLINYDGLTVKCTVRKICFCCISGIHHRSEQFHHEIWHQVVSIRVATKRSQWWDNKTCWTVAWHMECLKSRWKALVPSSVIVLISSSWLKLGIKLSRMLCYKGLCQRVIMSDLPCHDLDLLTSWSETVELLSSVEQICMQNYSNLMKFHKKSAISTKQGQTRIALNGFNFCLSG